MWILIGVIVALLLAALIFLACQQGSFEVKRSLEINAAPESVFAAIVDLKSWPKWSPWLLHEADAHISYSDNYQSEGGYYNWEGEVVGAGKLTHLEIRPGSSIRQQLEFLRPFKALNQVYWKFENRGDSTLLSWEMSGRMPFLLRFMNKSRQPAMERDFELGLALLAGYLNAAMPHPALSAWETEELEDFSYWAIPCNGNLRQLEAARRASIETLRDAADIRVGMALTLYHHFDPRAAQYQTEIAIPVIDNSPGSNYQKRDFKGGRYCKLTLRGDLKFIPLGWHALNSHCCMHKIKIDPGRPALETYNEDPAEVSDGNQAVTTLYLPIKAS
ncbi:MAG: hypothetical protein GY875_02850 [Gammaproteobacteria bacterium]|nr:hypothetical protein [Gammaproteobacteria bacterium]